MGHLTAWAGAPSLTICWNTCASTARVLSSLKNIAGLMGRTFADTFVAMLDSLRGISGEKGRSYYTVSTRLVDTAAWGIPHNKNMLYIVCLVSHAMSTSAPFLWPRRSARTKPIDDSLQPMCGGAEAYFGPKSEVQGTPPLSLG